MNKHLFYVAAAVALTLTACTSEEDIALTGQDQQNAAPQEVGFDVYTQEATNATRAGLEGTMTTSRMQRSEYEGGGFGVYAFQTQDAVATAGDVATSQATAYASTAVGTANVPNFMLNEKLLWNATNQGWYYNPLKYWPNETDNDSQDSEAEMLGNGTDNHTDRLTFFAYAPYVKQGVAAIGITYLTNKAGYLDLDPTTTTSSFIATTDPTIGYKAALEDPNKAVDLLWGVAPAGGLTYTAVNGRTVNVNEGMPLIDMTKPNVNTNMKFLFQHALARIGVTAVAAIDQVGAGGTLDPNTKITIEKITLTGYFGETGFLNLNNTSRSAGVANWIWANGINLSSATFPGETPAATDLKKTTLTLVANHADPIDGQKGTIATHLQFVGTPTAQNAAPGTPLAQTNRSGVTTVRQNVIQPALIDNDPGDNRNWYTGKEYASGELLYSETTPYYTNDACTTLATAKITGMKAVTKASDGSYTYVTSDINISYPMDLKYYDINKWVTITADNKTKYKDYVAYDGTTKAPTGEAPVEGNVVLERGIGAVQITASNISSYEGYQGYKLNTNTLKPMDEGQGLTAGDYVIVGTLEKTAPAFEWTGAKKTFYKRDANYFMVIPTNNFVNVNSGLSANEEKLRTVRVMIEYYITTEDGKLNAGRAQTKNVITKDVVFPSLANGKSYNLNLVLGLTSVKMEAEVDDWKVINVQGDLPQNTAE